MDSRLTENSACKVPPVDRGRDRVLILVKALPHVGLRYGETVCCAGLTAQGDWRRQYPVNFRRLEGGFGRWDWVEYDWRRPGGDDRRTESRRVQQESIRVVGKMPEKDRPRFLDDVIVPSCEVALERGQTLALIRPISPRFSWQLKSEKQLTAERAAYKRAASQLSMFDAELAALDPCPYAFRFDYRTSDGRTHTATCDDWETAATFYKRSRGRGAVHALESMARTFNVDYAAKGMCFAMGTHSRFPKTWLLVGVVRVDEVHQASLRL